MSAGPTTHREPDEVLEELGRRLDRAYDAAPARSWPRWRSPLRSGLPRRRATRWVLALAAVAGLAGSTAVATHETLFAPSPPALPDALGGAGAVHPDTAGSPVYVAAGTRYGIPWKMSASLCRYGDVVAVGLFLDVPGGGAGARCDVASDRPGSAQSPLALRERRTQTYIDPASGRTWVFGVLPGDATTAVVRSRALDAAPGAPVTRVRAVATAIDPRAVGRGIPADLRVFVVATPGVRQVAGVDALDAAGAPVLRCRRDGRCVSPVQSSPEESRP